MIKFNDISKKFDKTLALDHISFEIQDHSIIGLIGANGAGKSTLMKIIAGLIKATSGSAEVKRQYPYSNICLMSDFEKMLESYSLKKLYKLMPEYYPSFDVNFAKSLAAIFEVNEKKSYIKLSKGQRGKINTIIALASRAEITLLDESYISLDAPSRHKLFNIILDEFQNHPRTFIISTHYVDEVSRIFDEILLIHEGKLLVHDQKDSIEEKSLTLFCSSEIGQERLKNKNVIYTESIGKRSFYSIFDTIDDIDLTDIEVSVTPLEKWFVHMIGGQHV